VGQRAGEGVLGVVQVGAEHRDGNDGRDDGVHRGQSDSEHDVGLSEGQIACPGRHQGHRNQTRAKGQPGELPSAHPALRAAGASDRGDHDRDEKDDESEEGDRRPDVGQRGGHRAEHMG